MSPPKSSDLLRIVRQHFPKGAHSFRRFETGLAHYVYEVMRREGDPIVVRIADPDNWNGIPGGVYWHRMLKPRGVPLPDLIAHDLGPPYPYMILERLPGTDLGHVYANLTVSEKQMLAVTIADVQDTIAQLPPGPGFGWLESYETQRSFKSWGQLIARDLHQSREKLAELGVFDPNHVASVEEKARAFEAYFSTVKPQPFLDDTTTKNVILHKGVLSGIVDVDNVCFGDRLYVLALTQMALLSDGQPTDYVDFWSEAWKLTGEQVTIMTLYTAIFCVGFMAEVGQSFNKETPAAIDPEHVARLENILNTLLIKIV